MGIMGGCWAPLRPSVSEFPFGRLTFPYRIMEAMRKLTTRQLESRLLRAAGDHRCEITGVKFRADLLNH
jgi:hypothetical protein